MKLEKGKQYKTIYGNLFYMGQYEDYPCTCDVCNKNCNKPHAFEDTNDGNPTERYTVGTASCIKKFVITNLSN